MGTETRTCQNCKQAFTIEPDEFVFYEKIKVPPPTWCPECRFKRRAVFRNELTLYNRECGLCKQKTVSMYHPAAPYTIYCPDCWLSDKWDPFSYARDYDLNCPFFEQLGALIRRVPKSSLYRGTDFKKSVNSDYSNFESSNKDCYLVANSGPNNENCVYSRGLSKSRDVFDGYYIDDSEKVHEGIGVHKSSGIIWSQNVLNCLDSAYLLNCTGVQSCFGCVNLRYKSHHFLNEPLSKDEYCSRVAAIMGSYRAMQDFQKQFVEFSMQFPRRETANLKSADVTGDYIFESKNCHACLEISFCENVKYSFSVKMTKDSYDLIGHGRYGELLLEGVAVGTSSRVIGGWWIENSRDIEYCLATRVSQSCIGCDGIRNAKYVILNKRYSEEEYKTLKAHIVEELTRSKEYGLYLPPSLALFAYNETIGRDNLPISKEEAQANGFRWQDDVQMTTGKETIKSEAIPDHIRDVPDSILNEILLCMQCGRNYRIIRPELEFYRRMIVPIPRQCFFCRHANRVKQRGSFTLYDRKCGKCNARIWTSYAPDRPEIVYCEQCYNAEVA